MAPERIAVITGGAGFIGTNLCRSLLGSGLGVRVVDDLSAGRRGDLPDHPRLEFVRGDVADADLLARAFAGSDVVFHLAARTSIASSIKDPLPFYRTNIIGTATAFEVARCAGVRRVVWTSSSSAYGDATGEERVEGQEGRPLSPYAASKRAGEAIAQAHSTAFGQDIVGFRPFNVYGPPQRPRGWAGAVVPNLARSLLRDEAPRIFGDGHQIRDLTSVHDVVRALVLAADSPRPFAGEVLNLSGGNAVSIRSLLDMLRELTGRMSPPALELPPRGGEVRTSKADLTRVRALLGWSPQVALADGLRNYLTWLAQDPESMAP